MTDLQNEEGRVYGLTLSQAGKEKNRGSARWNIELDGTFSAINAGQEPPECDCIISERRLCFRNVGSDIVPNYRCQVQVDAGSDVVECSFQVQIASLPTIDSILDKTTTVNQDASATLTLRLSEPGLPIPTISWLKDSNPLNLGGRYSIDSAGSLTIANVVAEDRGAYQVWVSNIAGTVTADYMLFVNFAVINLTYSELVNGDGSVTCEASGWPAPSQDVSLTGSSTQVRTSSPSLYEVSIVATETISNPAANCLPSYTCTIAFGILSLSQSLNPSCGTLAPPILILGGLTVDTITTSSAIVRWSYNGNVSFTITVSVSSGSNQTLTSSLRMITLSELVPGTEYSVVVSVTGDPTTTTMPMLFTTISCLPSTILTVTATTVTHGNERTIRLTWEVVVSSVISLLVCPIQQGSVEANATGYRVYVDPCGGDFPCTPLVSGRYVTSYDFPTSICDGRQYSFHVQSINECGGGGPNSSVVLRTCAPTAATLSTGVTVAIGVTITFIVSTILGFLAGLLVMYSSTRKKAEYSTEPIVELTTPANPVYEEVSHKEEVELNSNQAYGPLGPPKEEMELNTNQAYGPLGPPKEEMELNTNQAYGPLGL
ncbi:hemicentin-1-like isoform X2 [Halichondria panicea]|uniref:hemicentin-1-like isoform X2 n=1 Tax=Halichondria panicea TaxID=6063 RepID=UPI00312BB3EA